MENDWNSKYTIYLNAQKGTINSAMKIMDRILQLKTLASAPTITNVDKASYNKEFIEPQIN